MKERPTSGAMSGNALKLHEQFITDKAGNKRAVVLDFEEYKELLGDYKDLLAMLEAQKEPPIPWEEAKKELRRDGLL